MAVEPGPAQVTEAAAQEPASAQERAAAARERVTAPAWARQLASP